MSNLTAPTTFHTLHYSASKVTESDRSLSAYFQANRGRLKKVGSRAVQSGTCKMKIGMKMKMWRWTRRWRSDAQLGFEKWKHLNSEFLLVLYSNGWLFRYIVGSRGASQLGGIF